MVGFVKRGVWVGTLGCIGSYKEEECKTVTQVGDGAE